MALTDEVSQLGSVHSGNKSPRRPREGPWRKKAKVRALEKKDETGVGVP